MNNQHDGKDHGWTPTNRHGAKPPHLGEYGGPSESKWTKVSANVFVSAVLSGSRAPFIKAATQRHTAQTTEKQSWWKRIFPTKKTA